MFPVLARLCVLHPIINTHNSKEYKSTSRSVRSTRSDRNAYREKLDCVANCRSKSQNFLRPYLCVLFVDILRENICE